MSGSPEVLLRSALEKIVFFECRVASLESELDATRMNAARAREEASGARCREAELEALLARARGEQAAALAETAELRERVRLLEAERERFLSGMVEAARVAGAPAGDDEDAGNEHQLAGFISELRAEIDQLRAWKQAAESAGVQLDAAPAPDVAPQRPQQSAPAVPAIATRFQTEGRLGPSPSAPAPAFSTRSERALYEASLDDLGAADPATRRRAADGLRALGSRRAAPLVAAALARETEAEVKTALLAALGALAEPSAAEIARRELGDARPAVRAAALEAASALARDRAVPQLAAALADGSPLVRRRASMLLAFTNGDAAEEALSAALADQDAGVARAAAVALSGRASARAQGALARALDHREAEVRRIAARAVGRWSGEAIDTGAPEPERRTAARRLAEKLLALDEPELRNAVMRVPQRTAARRRKAARTEPVALRGSTGSPRTDAGPSRMDAGPSRMDAGLSRMDAGLSRTDAGPSRMDAGLSRTDAVESVRPEPVEGRRRMPPANAPTPLDPDLGAAVLAEIRAALRGRTIDELSETLAHDRATLEGSLRALVAQGRLVVRGPRFFMS